MKSKSTFTVILFYTMIGFLMISIHQNIRNGFAASYVFYMFTLMLFLGFTYRKINESKDDNDLKTNPDSKPKQGLKQKGK